MYEDETLVCRDCGQEFVFSASEQAFFAEKGFMNKPSRCPKCRAARRAQNGNQRCNSTRKTPSVFPNNRSADGAFCCFRGNQAAIGQVLGRMKGTLTTSK